jgi:uroporphyrinogen III methyltransferase/synthase
VTAAPDVRAPGVRASGPLAGRRVAVTRAREQSALLIEALERLGAEPIEAPAITLVDPPDWGPLAAALVELVEYDWIVFTSANTLPRLRARLLALGLDVELLSRVPARIMAIGPSTARGLEALGLTVTAVPASFRAEGAVELFAGESLVGQRVLIPRALEGQEALADALVNAGARVDVVPVYAARPWTEGVEPARAALLAGRLDAVTLTSGAIARAFIEALGDARGRLAGVTLASIGPVTSQALAELGLEAAVEAREATIAALVAALVEHYAGPIADPDEGVTP